MWFRASYRLILLTSLIAAPGVLMAQSDRGTDCDVDPRKETDTKTTETRTPAGRCATPEAGAPNAPAPAIVTVRPTAGPTAAVAAEPHWEITPQLGMYVPIYTLTNMADDAAGETRRQVGAGALGARVGVRVASHFGVEGAFFYSPSLVAVSDDVETVDLNAGVVMGSARGVLRFGRTPEGWNLYAASGLGVVGRYGSAWKDQAGTLDPALVVAAGAKVPLGRSGTAFRLDFENYISRAQFKTQTTGATRQRTQHDIVWSIGIAIPVVTRR